MRWSLIFLLIIICLLVFPVNINSSVDGDGLLFHEEVKAGTNPFLADTDRDGINDSFEERQPNLDPLSKDILVEVDYDVGEKPRGDFENLERLFENAPVENPDGTTGIDMYVKIDDRISLPYQYSSTDYRESQPSYDNSEAIHAVIVEDVRNEREDVSGVSMIGTNGILIEGDSYDRLSFVLLHELGHQLGLLSSDFGGIDSNLYRSTEYRSVMNYNCNRKCDLRFSNSEPFNDWEHIEKTLSER